MSETPKGRGRPKKVAKGFGKRKLNFDNVDASNLCSTSSLTDTVPVSSMNNAVMCDECGEKIIISDPKRNNVKCVKCKTVMRVSDLKAVSPVNTHNLNADTISIREPVPVALTTSESNCTLNSVAQNTVNNAVICDECGEKIIINDPKRNNVKCLNCETVMRVSDLKPASPVITHNPNADTISTRDHVPIISINSGESNCFFNSVAQNIVNNAVICDDCGEKIIIKDPKRNNIKCLKCNTVMRVSDLRPASPENTQSEMVVNCSKRKITDDVSDDSILIPDKRTNEIVDDIDFHNATPIGLKNTYYNNDGSRRCANVCFFNAVIQILVSIPDYRNYIMQSSLDNVVVTNLKRLFRVMNNSNSSVHTYENDSLERQVDNPERWETKRRDV